MNHNLTDALVKRLATPEKGRKPKRSEIIYYDSFVPGFGIRVTAAGARSFVLTYRTRGGRERRCTIGQFPVWQTRAAREEAKRLKLQIDQGRDPLAELQADREAPTVADLCNRFVEDELPRKAPRTRRDCLSMIRREVLPHVRHLKVSEVTFSDIDGLHRKITRRGKLYLANRVVSLLSKTFNLSIKWGWRTDNPCRGVERNYEVKRQRYLTGSEIACLTEALATYEDQQAADIVRLLLLTGARSKEVFGMRWDQVDLEAGAWTKPAATTKQKREHRVPLSAPACQVLSRQPRGESPFVFPGPGRAGHRESVRKPWAKLCQSASIAGVRVHDLRHSYASLLASSGFSLPMIGALLGHTQPATTARYAHLLDEPLRQATERVGAIVAPQQATAEVVKLRG